MANRVEFSRRRVDEDGKEEALLDWMQRVEHFNTLKKRANTQRVREAKHLQAIAEARHQAVSLEWGGRRKEGEGVGELLLF